MKDRDTKRVIANAAALMEIRGDAATVLEATTYVEDHGFTPFDTLHLVEANGDTIVSSDDTYDTVTTRLDRTTIDDE